MSSVTFGRWFSIGPPLSYERLGGGAPALVFSFALIRAPFERRGCRRFRGLLPLIPAWFSRVVVPAARPPNRPASTIRIRPGTAPATRQTNLPGGWEHPPPAVSFPFEPEAPLIRPPPSF